MLIGLTGLAGSGKSEAARILIEQFGFERVKFADPLKNMIRRMLADMGHIAEDVERMIEGDLKEVEIPELGVTPRRLMVTLGTEWGRDLIRADLWTRLWAARVDQFDLVIADDVRFPNEVDAIRARGGALWKIDRPGLVRGDHSSEALEVEPDLTIYNSRSLEDFRLSVELYAREYLNRARACA
jgi:hypothetical protein